jgi:menaquinone-dependent protoporphyrinogen oxidase
MKIIILYMSSHGCSEKVANTINERLDDHEVTLHNLKNKMLPHLNGYDVVIIGGSIHAGSIQSKIRSYCVKNEGLLLQKKLGLYLCCMEKGDVARKQFDEAYPANLRKAAIARGLMGGEFNFDKMNFFEKAIVKKVAKIDESISEIKFDIIDDFIHKLKESL